MTANESLEADRMAGELDKHAIEAVEDGETYIEMDLGLGVVEERRDDQGSSISDDDGESKGKEAQLETETGESDVLGRLMGHRTCRNLTSADKAGAKPKIEEVGEK
ncbi:MAG: hypothetical protein M1832_004304 [Thelocarpon impressellum]|nr:MAG: hypothetical protein M1832_004304 [Thelocarpon impressellum]